MLKIEKGPLKDKNIEISLFREKFIVELKVLNVGWKRMRKVANEEIQG